MTNNNPEIYNKHESKIKTFFRGTLFGAFVGLVLGILFAPAKGDETRKKIKSESEKALKEGKETIDKIKSKVGPAVEDTKFKVAETVDKVEKESKEIKAKIKDLTKTIEDTTKNIKKKYFKGTKEE